MKYTVMGLGLALSLLTSACSTSYSMNTPAKPTAAYAQDMASEPGSLASLLTGQIVTSEEQQLRDIQTRQIVLDFPIKVGVIFYQLNSKLDTADQEVQFNQVQKSFKDSGLIRETLQIPATLISGAITIDQVRRLGARFQCDIMILVSGSHQFDKSRSQQLSFWDSFSEKQNYESKVKLDAIALDVYTGTLLSPFDAATKGGPFLLDRAAPDYSQQAYEKQKTVEQAAWKELEEDAIDSFTQLKADVLKRMAQPTASPSAPTT